MVWQRITLPDGSSLRIDNVLASDASGFAGLADQVDFHTWTLLKGVALATLIGVGSELSITGESDLDIGRTSCGKAPTLGASSIFWPAMIKKGPTFA